MKRSSVSLCVAIILSLIACLPMGCSVGISPETSDLLGYINKEISSTPSEGSSLSPTEEANGDVIAPDEGETDAPEGYARPIDGATKGEEDGEEIGEATEHNEERMEEPTLDVTEQTEEVREPVEREEETPTRTEEPPATVTETSPPPVEEPDPVEPQPIYRAPTNEYEVYLAACATANVRVRCGAGTSYSILHTLGIGDSLPYLWREGEWIAVRTGERVGYLSAAYAYVTETNLAIERTIRAGLAMLGTPYEWGATRLINDRGEVNPYFTGRSFDCSSFVQYCYYKGMGIKLGNYTGSQADYTVGRKIYDYSSLKRGDFYFTGTGGSISHVVIYLGGGRLLQAYSANGGPVSVTTDEKWKSKFLSGRRPDPTVVEQYK